jgi:hypothetical protein
MSIDTVDDLHGAEDLVGSLAFEVARLRLGREPTREEGLAVISDYCRPSCGFRTDGVCADGDDCGCLCDHETVPTWSEITTPPRIEVPAAALITWPDDEDIVAWSPSEERFLDFDEEAAAQITGQPVILRDDVEDWHPECPVCGSDSFSNDAEVTDSRALGHVDVVNKVFFFPGNPSYSDADSGVVVCAHGHIVELPEGFTMDWT